MRWEVDYSKWKSFAVDDELLQDTPAHATENEAEAVMQASYANEVAQEEQEDRLREMKIQYAVEAYEKRRPADKVLHHYWIKEAGDPDVVGEYFPTGDERCNAPVYKNMHGMILSRERQPTGNGNGHESYGWVIGNMVERRPLYGVQTDDLSVPTLGWQAFTAPEPVPIVRYYTDVAACRVLKEQGNKAFQQRHWAEAEALYTKALGCKLSSTEYRETLGLLLSNRAEARLRLYNFGGAADDAHVALGTYLKNLAFCDEATNTLKKKTAVRLGKAFLALKMFDELANHLQEYLHMYPTNDELLRLAKDMTVARGLGTVSSAGGASIEMKDFVTRQVEIIQAEYAHESADAALPQNSSVALQKLEYCLNKAGVIKGDCLLELQAVLRTSLGLRTLQQIIQAQWSANLDGKPVDAFKLPAAARTASLIGLACDACPENTKIVSVDAHRVFAILGGCNRKVSKATCENLISLCAGLMSQCRATTMELLQAHSVVVEQAAAFLSRALLAEGSTDSTSVDSPAVSDAAQAQAAELLFNLFAAGGRIERRALKGALPNVAGLDGDGFFISERETVRSLGYAVVAKATADPSLLTPEDVKNLLKAVQFMVVSGPLSDAAENSVSVVSFEKEFGGAVSAKLRYVDLDGWDKTEDGQHCAMMIEAVSKALEFRLTGNGRELERDAFEDAFHAGEGYFVVVPLLQAPEAFAAPALLCLSTLAQTSTDNVSTIVRMSSFHALVGLPCPESKPVNSCMSSTLRASPSARRAAAKLASRLVETDVAMEVLANAGEKSILQLVKLANSLRQDTGSLESFHDMLQVFYVISELRPEPLCRFATVDMLHLFVELAHGGEDNTITARALAIIQNLKKDKECKRRLRPILARVEDGRARNVEDDLEMLSRQHYVLPKL